MIVRRVGAVFNFPADPCPHDMPVIGVGGEVLGIPIGEDIEIIQCRRDEALEHGRVIAIIAGGENNGAAAL